MGHTKFINDQWFYPNDGGSETESDEASEGGIVPEPSVQVLEGKALEFLSSNSAVRPSSPTPVPMAKAKRTKASSDKSSNGKKGKPVQKKKT